VSDPVADGEMREYYDRRAGEYDDWWLGTGTFADQERPGWAEEVLELIAVVAALPGAAVLDVGCGTGFLTAHLAGEVVALDQSTAMLAIAGPRVAPGRVICGEALALPFLDEHFDRIFASHFYGHLEAADRAVFLEEAARVADELVIVESARRDGVAADEWQQRVLSDGSSHRVYKRYFDAGELAAEIGGGAAVLYAGLWFVAVAR
jgi:demethylmenaquinone methyltransferase/2-methoxy-6-polyprenyl-1,4-benzoquinol methylase